VREHDRQRHQLGRLAAGVAEHHALVPCSARVDAHGDVGGLLVDGGDHRAGLVIEPVRGVLVSDLLDRAASHVREVDVGRGRDLAGDEAESRRQHRLAGHPPHGVLPQDLVRIASEIWSAILSGCPSVTDSDEKR
jgi:hypothetical protein